jgi:hypothetical protein
VANHFDDYLQNHYPHQKDRFKTYRHRLPHAKEVDPKQYPNKLLPVFIDFNYNKWLPKHAHAYFEQRDKKALAYLPKVLRRT